MIPGVEVPVVAQRGIHIPAGWQHAVSISTTMDSKYGDGTPLADPDGTWVMAYSAHEGGEGSRAESRWNRGLLRCLEERVPVGVFVQQPDGQYRNLGAALIDSYNETTDSFVVHGPVSMERPDGLFDFGRTIEREESAWPALLYEGLDRDERVRAHASVVRRERQQSFRDEMLRLYGVCAMTEYDAPDALQAAHIVSYRGPSSNRPDNGLLLRADVHILFDRHLLSVDPDRYAVRISRTLSGTKYVSLEARELHLPIQRELWPSREWLGLHHEVFERAG